MITDADSRRLRTTIHATPTAPITDTERAEMVREGSRLSPRFAAVLARVDDSTPRECPELAAVLAEMEGDR